MKYIIYMDVFFVVNLIMDTLLLKMTAFLINPQTTFKRCLSGGCIGSFITCICICFSYDHMLIHMFLSYIVVAVVMILVTFGKSSVLQIVKRSGLLYIITMFTGGVISFLYNNTYGGYLIQNILRGMYKNSINFVHMCLFTGLSYILFSIILNIKKKVGEKNNLVYVCICHKGEMVFVKGLIDTGNSLDDPYTGKPVHIVEHKSMEELLKKIDIYTEKYRIVPFNSLGKKNGIIEVIECDEIIVYEKEGEKGGGEKLLYRENKPALGIYYGVLSSNGQFCMLLNKRVNSCKG